MAASSRGLSSTQFGLKPRRVDLSPLYHRGGLELRRKRRKFFDRDWRINCCCSDSVVPIRRSKNVEKAEEWRFDPKKSPRRVRIQATPALPFASSQSRFVSKPEKFYPRCTPRSSGFQSRDTPPKRVKMSLSLALMKMEAHGFEKVERTLVKTDTDADGHGWVVKSHDGSSEWKETVWKNQEEMLKAIHGGKHGKKFFTKMNGGFDFTMLLCNLARIERSAQKQAKSGTENAGWYEKWWEKYDAKGWTEKGAHKYGRLNEQSWWEKWGEHYDGRGSVLKWTDKWAETELGTKWGDKWEEKFFAGIGSRQGETWHVSPSGDRWSRTWGEEHFGNGKVHKYGNSTTGESWDIVVDEETYYEAEPHYGWADVVGDSSQLLSIEPQERPPGVYPSTDFGSSPPPPDDVPPDMPSPTPE
ncbi:hypothetical protein Acr_11g0001350 [Actinidia rufa]|uniref:Inactive purple acid phosphatase-like protein n=1 Tax=Actinidia rufa TaxID=165716 RepID=A0A7J0FC77_9ERIC|nr:hypothetical protein Acr_11g0001350 [Actinidia rufa]